MCDAGMPCISDPGARLVKYAQESEIAYETLPGANATVCAYASSGFKNTSFIFAGFLPHKAIERKKQIQKLILSSTQIKACVIIYESPHRIVQSLENIKELAPQAEIFLAKELSKLHETKLHGSIDALLTSLQDVKIYGEWCIVVDFKIKPEPTLSATDIKALDLPPKIRAKLLSKLTGEETKSIYQRLIGE